MSIEAISRVGTAETSSEAGPQRAPCVGGGWEGIGAGWVRVALTLQPRDCSSRQRQRVRPSGTNGSFWVKWALPSTSTATSSPRKAMSTGGWTQGAGNEMESLVEGGAAAHEAAAAA